MPAKIKPKISRQETPAINITNKPALVTSNEVPKSGCLAISSTGSNNITRAMNRCLLRGGILPPDRYQASIIGTANFIISDGWKRNRPRSSQRWAPRTFVPISSTAISMMVPIINRMGDQRRIVSGEIWAINSITIIAIPRRIPWRCINAVLSPPAL